MISSDMEVDNTLLEIVKRSNLVAAEYFRNINEREKHELEIEISKKISSFLFEIENKQASVIKDNSNHKKCECEKAVENDCTSDYMINNSAQDEERKLYLPIEVLRQRKEKKQIDLTVYNSIANDIKIKNIIKKRKELDMSVKELSDAIGLGKNGDKTIRELEKGEIVPNEIYDKIMSFATYRPFSKTVQDPKFTFMDLFAGIGGIRIPFQEAGGKCVFTCEIDRHAQKTYKMNFGGEIFEDITQVTENDVPYADILLGGFPCQPFSNAGIKLGFDDDRGNLFLEIVKILRWRRPKAFLLENVQGLVNHNNGDTLSTILRYIRELNYTVDYKILKASDFGVPQLRPRVYIVGFDKNLFDVDDDFSFIFPSPMMVRTTVGDILEEKVDDKYTISERLYRGHVNRKKNNHENGKGFGCSIVNNKSPYTSTISARYYKDGSEALVSRGEEECPRKLTPRECARLQGFPDEFIIPVSDSRAYKQFGNSVAVPVIRAICSNILNVMTSLKRGIIEDVNKT